MKVFNPLTALFSFVTCFTGFHLMFDATWGTNDISGYDLILSGRLDPFMSWPPYMAPLNIQLITNIFVPALGPYAFEFYLSLPLFIFALYTIATIKLNPSDNLLFVRNLLTAILSIPVFSIILHDLHSTVVSTLFIALIFYDTFVINRTTVRSAALFLFFIIILIVGNRVGNGFYIFCQSVFFIGFMCAAKIIVTKKSPHLRQLLLGSTILSILFGTAIVGSSLIGQDQRKEIIGGHFTAENTARHFVQVENTLNLNDTLRVLDLEKHEAPLINFSALPAEKFSGQWFKDAAAKLKPYQDQTLRSFAEKMAQLQLLPGKSIILWQLVILGCLGIGVKVFGFGFSKTNIAILLFAVITPILIALAVSLFIRFPPLRVWIPIFTATNLVLITVCFLILENYKLRISGKRIKLPKQPFILLKVYHFTLFYKINKLPEVRNSPFTFRGKNKGHLKDKAILSSGALWKHLEISNFTLTIILIFFICFTALGILKINSHYQLVTASNCDNYNEIWMQLGSNQKNYVTFVDGIYNSKCYVRPYSQAQHADMKIYPLGGTSFLTNSFKSKFTGMGKIEGLLCDHEFSLAMKSDTKLNFQKSYPRLSKRLTFRSIKIGQKHIDVASCS